MIEKQPLELNREFQYVLDLLEKSNTSIFLTGKAGTGKSTLLQLFKNTTRKKAIVLAPTGIAALNVGGQTIHSFFGFPPRPMTRRDIKRLRNNRIYKNIEVLIIDEVSMVRADMLDSIDLFLRLNRDRPEPFGGLQVVLIGDLFQLPPVISNEVEHQLLEAQYASPYFFSAQVLREIPLESIELSKVYRQEARHFLRLLDAIRTNRWDQDDLEDLNERYRPSFDPEDFYITLSPRNDTVNAINRRELDRIPLPERLYLATVTGEFDPRQYPTDHALPLKLNAQVMFVKNDPERQFVNGTIGKVFKLDGESVTVQIEEGGKTRYVEVEPVAWETLRYRLGGVASDEIETEVVGTFIQFPLRLAWAITIHKSQGKTFDKVIIDLGRGAFEHGQTYVALSRCRTLEGIILKQAIRPQDILVDQRIVDYYLAMQ